MRIVFLDVDGVLNSPSYLRTFNGDIIFSNMFGYIEPYSLDPKGLEYLQTLVETAEAKIVITSTWRYSKELRRKLMMMLDHYGLAKEVIDWTPVIVNEREQEIFEVLNGYNGSIENFVILDDVVEHFKYLTNDLIHVNSNVGFTEENMYAAIGILTRKYRHKEDKGIRKSLIRSCHN